MAKTRKFYYAVRKGRDGPKVYDSWEEVWSYQLVQVMTKLLSNTLVSNDRTFKFGCRTLNIRVLTAALAGDEILEG